MSEHTLRGLAARLVIAALGVVLSFAAASEPHTAHGASFTVTKTTDTADGTCDADCSLREAIIAANVAPGADTINLPGGTYALTIVGGDEDNAASGDLDIASGGLTINAAGAANTTIAVAGGEDRVLDIFSGAATITGATIQDGRGGVGFGCECGGGILVRAGASLTLTDSVVTGNTAAGASSSGGGIANDGALTLTNVSVGNNSAQAAGGVHNGAAASLTMAGGALEQNASTTSGGGLQVSFGSSATLSGVLFSRNTANGSGGGIESAGTLTVNDSTINQNTAAINGGGIDLTGGTQTIEGSTITANTATGQGAGISSFQAALTLVNSTVSGNQGTGIVNVDRSSAALTNVTLTDGISSNFRSSARAINSIVTGTCTGIVTSLGHNLSACTLYQNAPSPPDPCAQGPGCPGDLTGDPVLGPLASNGGPTQTRALLSGSPAIDAGDSAACPPADQRGVQRPLDGNGDGTAVCDIGAFEAQSALSPASPAPTGIPAILPSGGGRPSSGTNIALPAALIAVAAASLVGVRTFIRRRRL
jgi:CSLREA domain-containing protein